MVVIGAGRIGRALKRLADDSGEPCALVTRESGWAALAGPPGDPILVATRNDDLDAVLGRVPEHRRHDLVFIQNGALHPWLNHRQLAGNTRGLLFMAVPDRESAPTFGTSPSPFTGPHALVVARWMVHIGASAQVVDWPRFLAWYAEKLMWNAAFGLMCQVHDGDVGTVCDDHEDELRSLVSELNAVCRAALNVGLEEAWIADRLISYSRTISSYRGAVKEWPWRNGWFVAEAVRFGVDAPVHERLLRAAGFEAELG